MRVPRFRARFGRLPSGGIRSPSAALGFYTVAHQLIHKLEPYQATSIPRPFHRSTWSDLRYWALLLDEDDAGITRMLNADQEIPTPEEWFSEYPAPA